METGPSSQSRRSPAYRRIETGDYPEGDRDGKRGFDDTPGVDAPEADPYADEYHYKSWWKQFRGLWQQSEKMTEEQIKFRADDAWECGDYKEMFNLMA